VAKQASQQGASNQLAFGYSKYDIDSYDSTGLVKTLWVFPWFRRWYVSWINRMLPRVSSITLNRNRVFVFPTARGLLFIISAFCVFLAGTNYANNLILGTGFLLFSLFMVTIWQSFLNILGLKIIAGGADSVFLGEYAAFKVGLEKPSNKPLYALKLMWPNAPETMTNLEDDHHKSVKVQIKPQQRGYFYPPRLTVETRFPFGTIRCWSHIALATRCVVYPKPIENDVFLGDGHEGQHGQEINFQSNEEFYELKKYQDGDNLNHVAWKSFSRGGELSTKHFAGYRDEAIWLVWDKFHQYEHELKVSYLCYWVLRFERENRRYGLEIPGIKLEPDLGENHLKNCLHALATFDAKEQYQPQGGGTREEERQ
jgi:uncharacterized protein (DUF58 family)